MVLKRSSKLIIGAAVALPTGVLAVTVFLRFQARRMRAAFDADARVQTPQLNAVVQAGHEERPIEAADSILPTLALLGDSWLAGEPVDSDSGREPTSPALLIGRGFSALTGSPVRVRSLAAASAGAEDFAGQVGELLRDTRMRRSRDRANAPRYAVISLGAGDLVHPLGGSFTLPILTAMINRLHREGRYRVIVLTCPNLGLLPGMKNPLRTVLRRSSRVLAGSQWVAAVSAGALPISMNQALRATGEVGLISTAGRYPSAAGYRQLSTVVLGRIADDLGAPVAAVAAPEDEE